MIECQDVKLRNGVVSAVRIDLQKAPLIVVRSSKGYVMCGYLDMNIANKLGDVAAKVTGVSSIENVLDAEVVALSDEAINQGLELGITGRAFLNKIMKEL